MPVSNNIEIRKATKEDAGMISGILHAAFIEFRPLYTDGAFNATVLPPGKVMERMQEGNVWIAFYNKEAVGTLSSILKSEGLYIRGMAVLPNARGLKIGKLLLEIAEREAYEKKCSRIFLSTTPFLFAAIDLYEKNGFIKRNKKEFYRTDLFVMDKFLYDQL